MKKNKTKKALASLAIVGMAMTMTPFNALADTGVTTARISGSDRIETAVKVADTFKTATTAIVAPAADANLVDALAAAPLAGKTTPILLTDNNNLSDSTKAELVKLGVKNVYVVGAISKTVVDQLNAMTGVTATALKGADRIATAAAVAGKLTNPAGSFVVGYGALADALSVASYAAANNYSILVANPDGTLPASEAAFKGSKVYIVGGPTLVANIDGATRLFGADRFATNQAVLKALTYTYNNVYVANGTDAHLVDSLVASSLAAVSSAPIVLADTNGAAAAADIHTKLAATAVVTALGGSSVVPDSVVKAVTDGTPSGGGTTTPTSPVTISSLATTGQKVGTGAKATPAVALVNNAVTVSASVNGASAANASITYLVTSSDNITAKDLNGNTLVDTTLNSPVIIGNDTFKASYSVPADADGNVKAVFTSTASSQETFNVVVEAPFSNAGQPVMSDVASIEWGAPGTMVLSPVYKSSNPDSLNFSAGGSVTKGLVAVVATMLPADGTTAAVTGQAVKFTMTPGNNPGAKANAYFTDAGGTAMVASGAVVGKGNPTSTTASITYVATTDANGQALVYINSNLPTDNSVSALGAIMNVGVQAQLVNGGGSSTTGYYQWKAVSQPAKVANVTPSAMLNVTGVEAGGTVVNDSAETATSGATMTISGTLQDAAGNPVKNATVAIQDYDVTGAVGSNNVQNDAFIAADGTTKLFSAVDYPMVTSDANGNFSVQVTANIPVTQSIQNSITKYYAFYVPPTIAISTGQSLPNTVTALTFVGNSNSGNFIDLVWQQGQTAQTVGSSHTSLMPNYATLAAVPQTMSFTKVVGNHEEMYSAAYNQTGTIIAPAAGNQFDRYALTYDLTAPSGINFETLGAALPKRADGTGIGRIVASYNQFNGFVLNALFWADGTVCYQAPTNPDGTTATANAGPAGFDPTIYASAYDGSGQLHYYLNSDQTAAVKTSGTAGSVNVNINAYSNTSNAGALDMTHAQGSASGTVNSTFTASNTVGSVGVVGDLSGINQYYPLLDGNAAPAATLTVAGVALPDKNLYDINKNGKFVVAPFNSYPAISTIPSQGLTMNLNADKNGTISNVDGYILTSTPTNVSVNVNSAGEVSVNNVKLWTADQYYKVVGYMPNAADNSITIIEQGTKAATGSVPATTNNFVAYNIATVGATPSLVANWTVDPSALPADYEGFLGFEVNGGQLIPQVASYYSSTDPATNAVRNHFYTPLPTDSTSTMPDGTFLPVTATTAYVSDKYSEATTITVTNSLNDQKATVTTNFTAATGGLVAIHATPSSVNSVLGGSQSITLTAQDAYGNPISNQTIYLQTGIQGLWITQINGNVIQGSVNMGSTSSTSMQTLNTPVPLFNLGSGTIAPAYTSASTAGITAYHLNDNTTPIVALTTGVDGTVAITLVDGNVTYVANTSAGNAGTNSYGVDPGAVINNSRLNFYADMDQTTAKPLGSTLINWTGNVTSTKVPVTGITVTGATATVATGATDQMTAAVLPANATDPSVVWSVVPGTGTTATITTAGLLTATGAGTVTVKATNAVSGVSGTAVITVTAATVNPFTVAPKFNVFEIDGTLDLTKAATVKATGTEGTVAGVVDATGAFKISTATFATESVKVQAYDAQGNAVGAPVSVVVM